MKSNAKVSFSKLHWKCKAEENFYNNQRDIILSFIRERTIDSFLKRTLSTALLLIFEGRMAASPCDNMQREDMRYFHLEIENINPNTIPLQTILIFVFSQNCYVMNYCITVRVG